MCEAVSLLVFHAYCDRRCITQLDPGSLGTSVLLHPPEMAAVSPPATQMPVKRESPLQKGDGYLPQQVTVTGTCQQRGQHQGPAVLLLPWGHRPGVGRSSW